MTTSLDALSQGLVTARSGIAATERAMAKAYEDAIAGLGVTSTLFARDIINQAVAKIQGELGEDLSLFATAMSNKAARNRDGRVTKIHQLAGERAVQATVRSYNRTRAARRKGSDYRGLAAFDRPNRFANGKLSRALASSNMFDARWDGISFINKPWLDRNAAQWYRLSFGAGIRGAQTPPHRNYNVRFFGETAFSMSLKSFGPSAGFSMPMGLWFGFGADPTKAQPSGFTGNIQNASSSNSIPPGGPDPSRRGLDQFFPGSFNGRGFKARSTAGIKGTAYLDAGVGALTRELGRGWSVLMTEWFEEAATKDTGPVASIGVSQETATLAAARLKTALSDMNVEVTRYKSRLAL